MPTHPTAKASLEEKVMPAVFCSEDTGDAFLGENLHKIHICMRIGQVVGRCWGGVRFALHRGRGLCVDESERRKETLRCLKMLSSGGGEHAHAEDWGEWHVGCGSVDKILR